MSINVNEQQEKGKAMEDPPGSQPLKPTLVTHEQGLRFNFNGWMPSSPVDLKTLLLLLSPLVLLLSYFFAGWYPSNGSATKPSNIKFLNNDHCMGRGIYESKLHGGPMRGSCRCYPCFNGTYCSQIVPDCQINAHLGDPGMFQQYWQDNGRDIHTVFKGHELMSYFASNGEGPCWFLEQELETQIRQLHRMVGNAVTEGRSIVVGTGSSQLYEATLYALAATSPQRTQVVSAAPYYSSHSAATDYRSSTIYKWTDNDVEQGHGCIEIITSPNNPDGHIRDPVIKECRESYVYDLAYYWPHYTPITAPVDQDIMLFTLSKCTGHAGSRIGWAIVKNLEVAKKMVKAIELNSIGVSRDSQIRTSHILKHLNQAYGRMGSTPYKLEAGHIETKGLFHYAYSVLEYRWIKIHEALDGGNRLSVPEYRTEYCNFFGREHSSHPAFAWIRCEMEDDCQQVLQAAGIRGRGGAAFGSDPKYVRVSLLDIDANFEILVERLASIAREQPLVTE